MKKPKRSTIIPIALTVYLIVMAYIGYPQFANGNESPLFYFGVLAISLLVIVLLHFNLKRQEKLRRERMQDIENNKQKQK